MFLSFLFFSEMFDLKMKYDESDNVVVRGSKFFADKVSSVFGKYNLFSFSVSLLVLKRKSGCDYHIIIHTFGSVLLFMYPLQILHIVGWNWKCYWKKKLIEPFYIDPFTLTLAHWPFPIDPCTLTLSHGLLFIYFYNKINILTIQTMTLTFSLRST